MEIIKSYKDFRVDGQSDTKYDKPTQKTDTQKQIKSEDEKPSQKTDNSVPQKPAGVAVVPGWKVY